MVVIDCSGLKRRMRETPDFEATWWEKIKSDFDAWIFCKREYFHLAFVVVGDTLPEPIRCLKVDADYIYAAAGNKIYAFMQGRKVRGAAEFLRENMLCEFW